MTREEQKLSLLKKYFGHEKFRRGQAGITDSILDGRDVMAIMPTGAGKSVCYQLPSLMLPGVTVVVSPLISLMKDQVNALLQAGIPAAYINSSLTPEQMDMAAARARQGAYKVIYVAPERLDAPSFKELANFIDITMIAVDEAHCVSQWGQDFRPSYLNIREYAASLPRRPIMAAFTATATDAVKRDIITMLGLRDPYCITTGFDRENLYYAVSEPKDKLAETVRLIKSYEGQSGIVYCSTRKNVELVCDLLNDNGIPCTRYHAGLSDEERRRNQDDFIYDRVRVMTATNAFGMGIDKSNISFVIHYNMPKNIESYYQEAGRAGRDGSEAVCTLLFSRKDIQTCKFFIENSNDEHEQSEEFKRREYRRLDAMVRYCTSPDCLRHSILSYFGEQSADMCAKCSNCAAGFVSEDVTVAAQKILSCVYRLAQKGLRMGEVFVTDVLVGSKAKKIKDFGADQISTYGIMADTGRLKVRAIINGLCDRGYLRRGDHDVLILTAKARELLFEGKSLTMTFKKSTAEDKPQAAKLTSRGGRIPDDPQLFDKLRALRTKLAAEAGVPAYIIFSDATLIEMCRIKPRDEDDFLTVPGVGTVKAERYGEQFTAAIREYMADAASETAI